MASFRERRLAELNKDYVTTANTAKGTTPKKTTTQAQPTVSFRERRLTELNDKRDKANKEASKRVETKKVAETIGLPSVEQQLKTATTAFTPQSKNRALRPMQGPPAPSGLQQRISANDQLPGRDLPVIGPILKGVGRLQAFTEPAAKVAEQLYTPAMGATALGATSKLIGTGLSKLSPTLGNSSKLLPTIGREAIKEGAVSALAGAGQSLASNPKGGLEAAGKQALYGGALGAGGGGLLAVTGKGIGAIYNRLRNNNVPEEMIQEILALPAPRQRGNVNTATTPDSMVGFGGGRLPELPAPGPLGLPAPSMTAPTTARIAQQSNPYRQQFETLMKRAKQLQEEGLFTPGREDADLESLWSQMAGREGVSLDELIQRAYPTRTSRVSPDLVQNARANQAAREVAGAPLPVRSTSDRLTQPQGVLGRVSPPLERVGRAPQVEVLLSTSKQSRPRTEVNVTETPVTPQPQQPVRNRGFVNSVNNSATMSEGVKAGVSQSLNRQYKPITNLDSVNAANKRIDLKGIDATEAQLMNKNKFKADDVATGIRLMQELQKSGNTVRAVSVAEKLAAQLTEAGQTVQAASILNRLSPEGVLLYAQRKVNKVNENLLKGQTSVKISEKQANDIRDAAVAIQTSGASQERAGKIMDITDRLKKGEDITADERNIITEFVNDLKTFVKPTKNTQPKAPKMPKEMNDARVRDRVVSFMDAQEQEALERIRARRNRLSSTPFDEWADYAIVGASKIVKGAKSFTDWSEQMVKDFGDEVRPHLANIFTKSQDQVTQHVKKINDQVISRAETIAENYIKKNEKTIKPDDVEFIRNAAQKVSSLSGEAQKVASQDLQFIMNGFEKAGVGRKLASAQYIAMLLNPKTQVRNIAGNELMYRIERLSRIIGTPIDMAVSKITGGPRTVTFKSGPKIWDDFFTPAKDYWTALPQGAKAGARGVSPEGLTSKYEIQGPAFRSKYNPLTYLEKALGASLQGFDYAAYTRATNQRLKEMAYLDALNNGVKGDDAIRSHMQTYMTNMDDAVHSMAKEYGKFSTLQDDSILATKILGFRRGLNKVTAGNPDFGLGSLVVPFAKTPANLLLRGLDYSPAGILKSFKQIHDIARKKNTDLTRADVIGSVSRALMGSGMGAAAYWLADKGAMFGQSNKDSEVRKLQQMTGIKDFQINGSALMRMVGALATNGDVDAAAKLQKGDTLWSYEWAQPTSMPMAIGSNIHQSVKEKQGALQTTGEAALSGIGTLFNSSVLSGIREAFQIPSGEDNAVKAIGMNLIKQAPGMFTPSILRNINTFFDDKVRETYSPDELEKITNPAAANIPGLAQQMPQRVNTLGEPQTKPNNFFDVFVSPSDRSKYNPSNEAQLVMDLLNETGDKNLAPRAVAKYLSGKDAATGLHRKVDLTPDQYVELQTIVGQETAKRIGKINPELPTDKKVELVMKALDEAGKIGRNKLKQDVGLRKTK